MAQGFKTGGRKKGTPNKRTTDLLKIIEEKYPDFDPVLAMIEIIKAPYTSNAVRAYCIKAVLPYFYPKRKPVEAKKMPPEMGPENTPCEFTPRRKRKHPDYGSETTRGYMD